MAKLTSHKVLAAKCKNLQQYNEQAIGSFAEIVIVSKL